MSTVQQLIEAAYSRSTANDPGKLAGDDELRLHLNRRYQSLCGLLAIADKDGWLARTTLSFSGSPQTATLPTDIIDIAKLECTDGSEAHLIPLWEKDKNWHLGPSVFRQGNSLISRGRVAVPMDWQITDDPQDSDLVMWYRDAPTTLTSLSSTLDSRFPVRFEDILVLDLAVYLSVKDEGRSPEEFKALKAEYTEAVAKFNAMVSVTNSAKEPE